MPTADLIARARDALPPDLYRQPAYLIVRPVFSIGRAYRVYAPDGRLAMFVRHPIFTLRQRYILFADEEESIPLIEVRQRRIIGWNLCHDVLDAVTGTRLGSVRTRGISSLWRDTWDILDADDRVCGLMREDSISILRRIFSFWPGRHHLELGGVTVARLTQIFRWIRKEFTLEILERPDPVDARFAVACALLAVMADVRRES
jgi:hypothetical protein